MSDLDNDEMCKFEVRFEATTFTDSPSMDGQALTERVIKAINKKHSADGTFPRGVVAVVSAEVHSDDGQGRRDIKCFATVTLHVEAPNEGSIPYSPKLDKFLDGIHDKLGTNRGKIVLFRDGTWYCSEVEEVEDGE